MDFQPKEWISYSLLRRTTSRGAERWHL